MPNRSAIDELNRRLGWALPAVATLVLGIFRLPELTRSPLWYDELFSVGVAGLPVAESLRAIVADHTNPPLFYLLLKGWMAAGGESDLWIRLLPCLFAMLLGAALVWLAREVRTDARAGVLAVALAAASPLLVDLANEVRAYSLLALLAALSLAATLHDRTRQSRETFAQLTICNIALVHTHYFGWLTVGAACLAALIAWPRADAQRIVRSAAYTLLAFLPWAGAVIAHAATHPAPLRNVAWIAPPEASAPLWLLRDFTGRSGIAEIDLVWLAFISIALLTFAARAWQRRRAQPSTQASGHAAERSAEPPVRLDPTGASLAEGALVLLVAAGFGVPLAVWAYSLIGGHSIWVQRYLLGAAAPAVLLTAVAIAALPPRRWRAASVAGFIWVAAACAALPQRAPTKFDWRRFVRRIDVAVGSPRDVYALEAFTAAPLQRYARAGMRVRLVRSLDELPGGDAWLVYRRESFSTGSAAEALRARGFAGVTTLAAETAGQRIVAVRVRGPQADLR